MQPLPKIDILGVDFTNVEKFKILEYIITSLINKNDSYYIVTPNPEMIVFSRRNNHFLKILNQARIALPDGIGVVLAGKVLGKPISERIPGADFLEDLCREIAGKPITVGFLGGRSGVAERTVECLVGKYPGLRIGFVGEEWGEAGFDLARKYQVNTVRRKHRHQVVDILFVAFGFPKQEKWMAEHVGKIPVRVMMGVGGTFDYLSGEVVRAPFILRALGLEWLFRLFVQPWRWRRQIALVEFCLLVLREVIRSMR
jgi:N-acetylglucosaminyldiphosphoundecaprenol N-acetyl-beta-D-mannosaminyltransferase